MSDLASRLAALKNPKKGPPCAIGVILQDLKKNDPSGYKALAESIDNHNLAATGIANTLAELGMPITVHSIRRHRKRGTAEGCACA